MRGREQETRRREKRSQQGLSWPGVFYLHCRPHQVRAYGIISNTPLSMQSQDSCSGTTGCCELPSPSHGEKLDHFGLDLKDAARLCSLSIPCSHPPGF